MDPEEFRAILSRSRVGIWALIEAAIKVASLDYGEELRCRRDKIVESLYAPEAQVCRNCNGSVQDGVVHHEPYYPENICNNYNNSENIENSKYTDDDDNNKKFNNDDDSNRNLNGDLSKSPLTPESNHQNFSGGEEEEDADPYGGLFDDEQTQIINIRERLEDPDQSEDGVVDLLQSLADMDITFQALKETDIGRHVHKLRKHESSEVRSLVKLLVSRWKDAVNEWVRQPQSTSNPIATDGDSPQQRIPKNQQNGHHQVPDFGYSPNPQNGKSSVERKYGEDGTKPKPAQFRPRKEAPSRPPQSVPKSASAPPNRAQRESVVDDERLNSARKRLHENYQEANNAKKQREIQVMDIHEIPKSKNAFLSKNKGGFQGRQHR